MQQSVKPFKNLDCIIGKSPFRAWKGWGSFILFEFGRKRRIGKFEHGSYTLWVFMAHWVLRHERKQLAHSESSDKVIERSVKLMERKKLKEIILRYHLTRHGVRCTVQIRFQGEYTVNIFPYEHKKNEVVFFLYTPTEFLTLDYKGVIKASKSKRLSKKKSS